MTLPEPPSGNWRYDDRNTVSGQLTYLREIKEREKDASTGLRRLSVELILPCVHSVHGGIGESINLQALRGALHPPSWLALMASPLWRWRLARPPRLRPAYADRTCSAC